MTNPFTQEAREARRAIRLAKRALSFREGAKSAQSYADAQLYYAEKMEREASAILLRVGTAIQARKDTAKKIQE